jgi:hypothetical protein
MISTCLPSHRGRGDGGRHPVGYHDLDFFRKNQKSGTMDGWKIEFYDTLKRKFRFFELFLARLAYKFAKSANMTPEVFFVNIFKIGIKKRGKFLCQY